MFFTDEETVFVFFKNGSNSGKIYQGPQDNYEDLQYFVDEQMDRLPDEEKVIIIHKTNSKKFLRKRKII